MSISRKEDVKKHAPESKIDFHAKRRTDLMKSLNPESIVILPAHPVMNRNRDIEFSFFQDSNFYYLTGFKEPEAIAVLCPGRKEGEYILFNRPKNPELETWTGKRAGQDQACEVFGADEAYSINDFSEKLEELLKGRKEIYFPLTDKNTDQSVKKLILKHIESMSDVIDFGSQAGVSLSDISPALSKMRLIKDDQEIELIRKAVQISESGHIRAMKFCKPGLFEYELEAELTHAFISAGARALAYPNIIGSGENTCILHYDENNRRIEDGDLVLMDAGAEYGHYSADITRTFPANGKFSKNQKIIYELVLQAQEAGIKAVKPGATWDDVTKAINSVLKEGLLKLDILEEDEDLDEFYMHGPGHWMGLDVHDAGPYRKNKEDRIEFQPGMVLTIEPGIYISSTIENVDEEWHNIGIRIEDDILVTKDGCEVLSRNLPKTVAEIEALMAKPAVNQSVKIESTIPSSTVKSFMLLGVAGGVKDVSSETKIEVVSPTPAAKKPALTIITEPLPVAVSTPASLVEPPEPAALSDNENPESESDKSDTEDANSETDKEPAEPENNTPNATETSVKVDHPEVTPTVSVKIDHPEVAIKIDPSAVSPDVSLKIDQPQVSPVVSVKIDHPEAPLSVSVKADHPEVVSVNTGPQEVKVTQAVQNQIAVASNISSNASSDVEQKAMIERPATARNQDSPAADDMVIENSEAGFSRLAMFIQGQIPSKPSKEEITSKARNRRR